MSTAAKQTEEEVAGASSSVRAAGRGRGGAAPRTSPPRTRRPASPRTSRRPAQQQHKQSKKLPNEQQQHKSRHDLSPKGTQRVFMTQQSGAPPSSPEDSSEATTGCTAQRPSGRVVPRLMIIGWDRARSNIMIALLLMFVVWAVVFFTVLIYA